MGFWLKNITFVVLLLGLAYYLLMNQEELFPTAGGNSTEEVAQADQTAIKQVAKIKPPISKNKSNAAADGLSKFYANIRGSKDKNAPRVRNNIVYLPDPKGSLVELLEARRLVTRPLRKNWRGTKDNRPFRKGETLHQKLVEFANADGLEVIWWLNRDFIVKDSFRIDKDIIATAYRVGKAVEGHFQEGLSTYFCYQQRTLVLIDKESSYLTEECSLLPLSRRYRN